MIVSEIGVIGTYNAELTVRKRIYFLKGKKARFLKMLQGS